MVATKKAKSATPLELFGRLKLDEIDAEIGRHQAEIDERQKKIDSLKAIRKAVDIRDNGRPPRKWSEKRRGKAASNGHAEANGNGHAAAGDDQPPTIQGVRMRIWHLLKRTGPLKAEAIAEQIGLPFALTQKVLDRCDKNFMRQSDDRWTLRPKGDVDEE